MAANPRKSARKKAGKKAARKKGKRMPELEARVEILERMVGFLASGYGYRSALAKLLAECRRMTKADAGTVMLADWERKELVFEVVQGRAAPKLQNYRMPIEDGVAGWVATHGEPLLIPDAQKDPRYNPKISRSTRYETRNMICIPITSEGMIAGVLQLLNHEDQHPFDEADMVSASVCASSMGRVAGAMEKALLDLGT